MLFGIPYYPYDFYQPFRPKRIRRIGLLGGTYDPTHHWHLFTGDCAVTQFKLDEMHYIPNGNPPHKHGVTDGEIRCDLLNAAISPNKRFRVSRCEIEREGTSYTVDTLRYYKRRYGEDVQLFYTIGSDNLHTITEWHDHDEIFELATILIAPRDHEEVSLDDVRKILPATARFGIIDCPGSTISSSLIRDRVAHGLTYRYAVTDSVWLGIRYYGLYLDPALRTAEALERGLIGPGCLAPHENWALQYFKRNPVTLKPYRFPSLVRLLHRVGYYDSSVYQEPQNEE
ncbi:MAG: nicotinate-nucleotide adenylyltransferase [Candidatus Obscuribacterales bacterium]|nr:nicotinate-nucleotide adenylyltransferase [Candidatus Obscuribacterales bacterium]